MTGDRRSAVIVNDTRVDAHHGCTRVMRAIGALADTSGLTITATARAHRDWRTDTAFVAALDRADVVIVNGEGTLHHDRPAGLALLAAGAEARRRGIGAALVNASWQANGAAFGAMLCDFDIVAARESLSRAEMSRVRDDVRLVPDLSLFTPVPPAPRREGIAFVDSIVPQIAGTLADARRRLGGTSLPIGNAGLGLFARLRFLNGAAPFRRLLRHPVATLQAMARTAAELPHQSPDDDAYVARLAASELVVTGRFHALMLGLAAGTPVLLAGSNTHKLQAVAIDAGLDRGRLIDVARLTPGEVARWRDWHSGEADNVVRYVEQGRAAMRDLFADIAALARRRERR